MSIVYHNICVGLVPPTVKPTSIPRSRKLRQLEREKRDKFDWFSALYRVSADPENCRQSTRWSILIDIGWWKGCNCSTRIIFLKIVNDLTCSRVIPQDSRHSMGLDWSLVCQDRYFQNRPRNCLLCLNKQVKSEKNEQIMNARLSISSEFQKIVFNLTWTR